MGLNSKNLKQLPNYLDVDTFKLKSTLSKVQSARDLNSQVGYGKKQDIFENQKFAKFEESS
jgi:hypothetical protein